MTPKRPDAVPRGNALLVTLIAVAVLLLLVVGAMQFTGVNKDAAISKVRGDEQLACAQVARRYLLNQLQLTNLTVPISLNPVNLPDDPVPSEQSVVTTGHYGPDAGVPTGWVLDSRVVGAAGRQVRDITNSSPTAATLGGSYYRVVVKCTSPASRESEVEFVIRYGI